VARLYSNENFPQPVVEALRRLGHDVLTSLEAGRVNQRVSDDEVIAFAKTADRAVLTLNRRHFHSAHRRSPAHAGIITCTVDADYPALAARIHRLVSALPDLSGQLIKVTKPPTP
jgi:hypothetical protein